MSANPETTVRVLLKSCASPVGHVANCVELACARKCLFEFLVACHIDKPCFDVAVLLQLPKGAHNDKVSSSRGLTSQLLVSNLPALPQRADRSLARLNVQQAEKRHEPSCGHRVGAHEAMERVVAVANLQRVWFENRVRNWQIADKPAVFSPRLVEQFDDPVGSG